MVNSKWDDSSISKSKNSQLGLFFPQYCALRATKNVEQLQENYIECISQFIRVAHVWKSNLQGGNDLLDTFAEAYFQVVEQPFNGKQTTGTYQFVRAPLQALLQTDAFDVAYKKITSIQPDKDVKKIQAKVKLVLKPNCQFVK